MWSKPWSYKEGLVIGAGLLVIGLLLQMTVGAINWNLFAYPVNVIVLVVYIIALVAMHDGSDGTDPAGSFRSCSDRSVGIFADDCLLAFCSALLLDGHYIGTDDSSCRFLLEGQPDFFSSESYRIVYCIDNSYFRKCRYAKVENDYPNGEC